MKELAQEHFSSLNELIRIINARPNNMYMRDKKSSETGDKSFTRTDSYREAISLMRYGYTEPVPLIKKELRQNKKIKGEILSNVPKRVTRNNVMGYTPNVPNALKGLPESMISIENNSQKIKTLNIFYCMGTRAGTEEEKIYRAGTALVSAINIVELSGIQTKLDLCFMPVTEGNEIVCPTVTLKNYGERFNLQKICFPMIHPSMFRRIGFKYLETCPICKENYSFGYGTAAGREDLSDLINKSKKEKTFVITTDAIIRSNYSIQQILKEMDVFH